MIEGPRGSIVAACLALAVLFLSGLAAGQMVPPPAPPPWSVGDWWVVECQVYDTGKVVRGAKPGWTPRQGWRFEVEGSESMAGQPYFVVSIRPDRGNLCPYWFRYWFRVSDRYVGRSELHHADPAASKPRSIGPPVVRQDFAGMPPGPFLSDEFPSLPLAMPLFDAAHAMSAGDDESEVSQAFEELPGFRVLEKADSRMAARLGARTGNRSLLARIIATSGTTVRQYWDSELPWCLYGERTENGREFRRSWLVDAGAK